MFEFTPWLFRAVVLFILALFVVVLIFFPPTDLGNWFW